MDSEGSGDLSDADLVVQNRTGGVQHATVRCQTSTSTIFSEMIELESGETATDDDLPQELIEIQVNVADGPKGSKMYDAETVTGTVAVGVTGTDVAFETTSEPVSTVSALEDLFDGEIGEASTADTSSPSADDSEPGDADGSADQPVSDTADLDRAEPDAGGADAGGITRDESDRGDPDRSASGVRKPGSTDRRTANADASESTSPDTSGSTATDTSGGDAQRSTSSDVGGTTGSDASGGRSPGGSDGSVDRTPGSASDGTSGEASETTSTDEHGPGPDEIHCRNCGAIIKQRAEICPDCGTQNVAQGHSGEGADAGGTDRSDRSDTQSASSGQSPADDKQGPGPDEIHCRNCGEIIREKAEICPECGTKNVAQAGSPPSAGAQPTARSRGGGGATGGAARPAQSAGPASGTSTTQRRSTGSEPSGAWVNGVRLGAGLWFLALLILIPTIQQYQSVTAGSGVDPGGMLQSLGLATLLPPVQLLAWVVLPLSLYFDLRYVDYHVDEWPLSGRLYIAGTAILPVLTQIFGAAALFIDGGGVVLAAIVPVVLLALSIRHLRTRSRLV